LFAGPPSRDSKYERDQLYGRRAVVVVEGVTPVTFVTGPITMIIIGVLLNIVGLGVFCWALFALAIHALPFFVGMTAALYAYQTGAGPFGAVVVGIIASSFTFVLGQYVFSTARSRIVRVVIGLLFAVPAARAGYDATLALSHIGIPSQWWREAFGMVGAILVGCTAWARLSILTDPASRRGVALGPAADWDDDREQVTLRVHHLSVGSEGMFGSSSMTATSTSSQKPR
jgi:hypothetical protein